MRPWLIVLAVAACGDKRGPPAPTPEPAPPPASVTIAVPSASAHSPAPSLPDHDPVDIHGLPAAQAFAAEHPDAAWKATTERAIHDRIGKLGPVIECRQTLCEVTIAGSQGELARAMAELQNLRELPQAQSLVLGQPEDRDDRLTIQAYVQFDRADLP